MVLFIVLSMPVISCNYSKKHLRFDEYGYEFHRPSWFILSDPPITWSMDRRLSNKDVLYCILSKNENNYCSISITPFGKSSFESLEKFENWVIRDYSTGQPPEWSLQHRIWEQNEIEQFTDLGNCFSVQIMNPSDQMRYCYYVLIETPKAYLWVNYTADKEIFNTNLDKLSIVLANIKLIN